MSHLPDSKTPASSSSAEPGAAAPSAGPAPGAFRPLVSAVRAARRPIDRFLRIEASSGILLLLAAVAAMVWANSDSAASYYALWRTPIGLHFGGWSFERPLAFWINDALMTVFFFVAGLEIKREIHDGSLSEWRRAALPLVAALGGMLFPALIYLGVAGAPELRSGWGVPTATDIAFALGVLALLGRRVPTALRVLLLALAIIDDLGAILVIAVYYSTGIAPLGMAVALAGILGIVLLQRSGVRAKLGYLVPATVVWIGCYMTGVHPTIGGVGVALLTPVTAWYGREGFEREVRAELDALNGASTEGLGSALRRVDTARREARSPAERLIEALQPWVTYVILPVFALANSGVPVSLGGMDGAEGRVFVGVALGLLVGKPLGVLAGCFVALKTGLGKLPDGVGWRGLVVLGLVAGVGFTMALFVTELAFASEAQLMASKRAVLAGSAVAAVVGFLGGLVLLTPSRPNPSWNSS